jgi:hypothetical protein
MGFEAMIPVFELAKTLHALDCSAAVIDIEAFGRKKNRYFMRMNTFAV